MGRPNDKRSRRDFVYDRDGERCVYCGTAQRGPTWQDKRPRRLTLDHVIPASRGGTNLRSNLVTCCDYCNETRRDMDIVEWLALLNPRESTFGERAVKLVTQAMKSDVLEPSGDELLKRILTTFSYVQ